MPTCFELPKKVQKALREIRTAIRSTEFLDVHACFYYILYVMICACELLGRALHI